MLNDGGVKQPDSCWNDGPAAAVYDATVTSDCIMPLNDTLQLIYTLLTVKYSLANVFNFTDV